MEQQVLSELQVLQQRLTSYLDQAKFAKAHLLDLGASQGGVN